MYNILVTGGAGFIGSHLVEELLNYYPESKILILDNLSSGKEENIPKSFQLELIKGDITDYEFIDNIFYGNDFDFIFHLAAIPSVVISMSNPLMTYKVNAEATIYLLEKAKKQRSLKRFVFASSAAVYGHPLSLPCKEEDKVFPISPYGVDKYVSEVFLNCYFTNYKLPITVFLFFNVFGPRQRPDSPYSGVISLFVKAFQSDMPEITIYEDGTQTRDFIYVKDVTKVLVSSLSVESCVGKTLNLCTGKETSILKLVSILEDITNKKAKISFSNVRAGDIKRSVGDNFQLLSIGLVKEFTDIAEGLKKLLYEAGCCLKLKKTE